MIHNKNRVFNVLEFNLMQDKKRTGLNSIKRKYTKQKCRGKTFFSFKKCSFNHKLVKGNKEKLYAMTHKNQLFI